MAYPLLISLANINVSIHSKASLHAYLLLTLLPIAKFSHKVTCIRSLLQDRLAHQALSIILSPFRTPVAVRFMMSDPIWNLHYCFTPIPVWITDTPEESLLAGTSAKVSPVTTATATEFGDVYCHPPCTAVNTLTAICKACSQLEFKSPVHRTAKRLETGPDWTGCNWTAVASCLLFGIMKKTGCNQLQPDYVSNIYMV